MDDSEKISLNAFSTSREACARRSDIQRLAIKYYSADMTVSWIDCVAMARIELDAAAVVEN